MVELDNGASATGNYVVANSLEMPSGRGKKEYAEEAQAVSDEASATNGASEDPPEAVVAM